MATSIDGHIGVRCTILAVVELEEGAAIFSGYPLISYDRRTSNSLCLPTLYYVPPSTRNY